MPGTSADVLGCYVAPIITACVAVAVAVAAKLKHANSQSFYSESAQPMFASLHSYKLLRPYVIALPKPRHFD
jgi:hypothetical protein